MTSRKMIKWSLDERFCIWGHVSFQEGEEVQRCIIEPRSQRVCIIHYIFHFSSIVIMLFPRVAKLAKLARQCRTWIFFSLVILRLRDLSHLPLHSLASIQHPPLSHSHHLHNVLPQSPRTLSPLPTRHTSQPHPIFLPSQFHLLLHILINLNATLSVSIHANLPVINLNATFSISSNASLPTTISHTVVSFLHERKNLHSDNLRPKSLPQSAAISCPSSSPLAAFSSLKKCAARSAIPTSGTRTAAYTPLDESVGAGRVRSNADAANTADEGGFKGCKLWD